MKVMKSSTGRSEWSKTIQLVQADRESNKQIETS